MLLTAAKPDGVHQKSRCPAQLPFLPERGHVGVRLPWNRAVGNPRYRMRSDGEDREQRPRPTQRDPLTAIRRKATFGDSPAQCRAAKWMRPGLQGQRVPRMVLFGQGLSGLPLHFARREQMRPLPPQQAKLSPLSILLKTTQRRALPLVRRPAPPPPARAPL